MATTVDFIEFVLEQLSRVNGEVRHKKMFGEYCVYVNDKPILLVCNNTVFVKTLPCIEQLMGSAKIDEPYKGAKAHYLLDIEDMKLIEKVIPILEQNTPLPKPRKRRDKSPSH